MQERVVNGVLCRRLEAPEEWTPVSRPELTKMLVDLRKAYKLLAASAALVKEDDEPITLERLIPHMFPTKPG